TCCTPKPGAPTARSESTSIPTFPVRTTSSSTMPQPDVEVLVQHGGLRTAGPLRHRGVVAGRPARVAGIRTRQRHPRLFAGGDPAPTDLSRNDLDSPAQTPVEPGTIRALDRICHRPGRQAVRHRALAVAGHPDPLPGTTAPQNLRQDLFRPR